MRLKSYDAVIIGGGISGLSCAYYLGKARPLASYALVEATKHLGGKIQSRSILHRNSNECLDVLLEFGPDSLIVQKSDVCSLITDLGLEPMLIAPTDMKNPTWVLRQDGLSPLPEGIRILPQKFRPLLRTKLLGTLGKLRAATELFIPPKQSIDDESVASFILRRFGKDVLENITEPLITGIFHAQPEDQSMLASFPQLVELEKESGSILLGVFKQRLANIFRYNVEQKKNIKPPYYTLRGGMSNLPKQLVSELHGDIFSGMSATAMRLVKNGCWEIEFNNKDVFICENVILTTPAFVTAKLLEKDLPKLSNILGSIKYAQSAILNFIAPAKTLNFTGSGIISAKSSHSPLNAITFSSQKFNTHIQEKLTVLRVSIGGSRRSDLLLNDDKKLFEIVEGELERIFQTPFQPLHRAIQRWPTAVPIYQVGHSSRISAILAALPVGLTLAGNYLRGTGIADCIHSARLAVDQLNESFSSSPL